MRYETKLLLFFREQLSICICKMRGRDMPSACCDRRSKSILLRSSMMRLDPEVHRLAIRVWAESIRTHFKSPGHDDISPCVRIIFIAMLNKFMTCYKMPRKFRMSRSSRSIAIEATEIDDRSKLCVRLVGSFRTNRGTLYGRTACSYDHGRRWFQGEATDDAEEQERWVCKRQGNRSARSLDS